MFTKTMDGFTSQGGFIYLFWQRLPISGEDYLFYLFLVKITFFCNLFDRNETEICTYL